MIKFTTTTFRCALAFFVLHAIAATAHSHSAHKTTETTDAIDTTTTRQFEPEILHIPDVSVTDQNNHEQGFVSRFADAGPVVISLTYTGCETLCPITHVILQQLDMALQESSTPDARIITLSIDSVKDTPEALSAAATELKASDRWTWLAASEDNLQELMQSLNVDITALEAHDPMLLIGDVGTGEFIRVLGMPDPDYLLAMIPAAQSK